MPTYQYRCTECGSELEVVQKFSDAALTECPNCTGVLRKVFNAVGVVFKGSGFYRTDSRSSKSSTDLAAPKAESSQSSSNGDSGKGDSAKSTAGKVSSDSGSSSSNGSGKTPSTAGSGSGSASSTASKAS